MRFLFVASASVLVFLLSSCGTKKVPLAELSESEQNLLSALNSYRASQGLNSLQPTADLTDLARKDASRRALTGEGYVDNRLETGYERMLTLAGKVQGGDDFGGKLMGVWQNHPVQKTQLEGSFSGAGVGTAVGASGLQTGVLLLGGFSDGGI